jgi:hypothetical protein
MERHPRSALVHHISNTSLVRMADAAASFLQFHIWMLKFLLDLFDSLMIGSCLKPQLLFNANLSWVVHHLRSIA